MRQIVFAFDTDGTLESSSGPVLVSRLSELQGKGHIIVIVSESPMFPRDAEDRPLFERVIDQETRLANLLAVKERYPDRDSYVYCSDNPGDDQVAEEAGFIFMHPSNFMVVVWD